MDQRNNITIVMGVAALVWMAAVACAQRVNEGPSVGGDTAQERAPERPDDPYLPPGPRVVSRPAVLGFRGLPASVQVNVDAGGNNIVGDAANEPSLAIDPTRPNRIVIGWRQFDNVASNFRQAGYAYSRDSGRTWTFPGTLEPGVFRSDPVLDSDAAGNIYYMSLAGNLLCDVFISVDGGVNWDGPHAAFGGDKEWFVVDKTASPGAGNLYHAWGGGSKRFNLSTDGGFTWASPTELRRFLSLGTLAVDGAGDLYVSGRRGSAPDSIHVVKSTSAKYASSMDVGFELARRVDLGGSMAGGGPNPAGLLGQVWVATDKSGGAMDGNVYLLCSVDPPGADPLNVMFSRSEDGGRTWSAPVRVNDDAGNNWQWFGTMSVAPNGRIDVIFNDTRDSGLANVSRLYYSSSSDAGVTWSANVAVSAAFDSHVGFPNQSKIGDYYDTVSDDVGASVAYAATFNNEEDVYFLRIGDYDCNGNGIGDSDDILLGNSGDANGDEIPDECQCLGDADGNFDVGLYDLNLLLGAFGHCDGEGEYLAGADVDRNGCVDISDLGLLLSRFGAACP